MARSDKNLVSLVASEHIGAEETGDNIGAKRVALYVWDSTTSQWERQGVNASTHSLKVTATITITSSTAETDLFSAGGSGVFLDLFFVLVTNTSATATEIDFKDSAAGTTRLTVSAPANDTRGYAIGEASGWPQATADNKWTATCADSVASIKISAIAIKSV